MAKFASREEKLFSPISQKLIDAVSGPAQPKRDSAERQEETAKVVQMRARAEESHQPLTVQAETPEPEPEAEERLTGTMRYHVSPEEKGETEEFSHGLRAGPAFIGSRRGRMADSFMARFQRRGKSSIKA